MTIDDFDRANEINSQLTALREHRSIVEKSKTISFGLSDTDYSRIETLGGDAYGSPLPTRGVRFGFCGNPIVFESILTSNAFEIAKKAFLDEIDKAMIALESEFENLGKD